MYKVDWDIKTQNGQSKTSKTKPATHIAPLEIKK